MHVVIPDDYQYAIETLDCYPRLLEAGHQVSLLHGTPASDDELVELLAEADALVLTRERTRLTAEVLARLPRLKLISQTGKVSGHIDLDACRRQGIAVAEGSGSPIAPAELTWTLILMARRQLLPAIQAFQEGEWQINLGDRLHGTTLGVWGYGKIGRLLAGYAKAFGMRVLVWGSEGSRQAAVDDGHHAAPSRDDFFAESDVLSLNLRLSDSTRHGVTLADLQRMKPDALLVNTSRAELIAPGALLTALEQGRPGMAALDVFETEPMAEDDPLRNHPRVLATPHLGYVERQGYELYFGDAFDNLIAYFAGTPRNLLIAP